MQKNICIYLPPLQAKCLEQEHKRDDTLPVQVTDFSSCTFDGHFCKFVSFFLSLCFLMFLKEGKTGLLKCPPGPLCCWEIFLPLLSAWFKGSLLTQGPSSQVASQPRRQVHSENGNAHEIIFLTKSVDATAIKSTAWKVTSAAESWQTLQVWPGETHPATKRPALEGALRVLHRSEAEEHKSWWASHTSLVSQPPLPATRSSEGLLQLSPAASFVSALLLCFPAQWIRLVPLKPAPRSPSPGWPHNETTTTCSTAYFLQRKLGPCHGFLHGIKQEFKVNEDLIQPQVFLTVKNKRVDY